MKTVLFLLNRYPAIGGIENVTTLLANRLCVTYKIIICSQISEDNINYQSILSPTIKYFRLPSNNLGANCSNIEEFDSIITKECVDVVIYQDSYFPNDYLLNVCSKRSVKLIVVEHSSPDGFERYFHIEIKSYPWWDVLHRASVYYHYLHSLRRERVRRQFLYAICNNYVMLSKKLIPQCQKYGNIKDDSKFFAIGNPIVIDNMAVDIKHKKNECVFVGRLDYMKGIDRLLRIWMAIEHRKKDWKLRIVGDGPLMSFLRNFVAENNLQNVVIEGFQKDVVKYYQDAKIYCMCSTYEGFPLVLPEAMGVGVVPIAFNSFMALQDIIDDSCGIAIKPFDENLYLSELLNLMDDDERLYALSSKCLSKSNEFNVERIVDKWVKLID